MSYQDAIKETDFASVSIHNKAELAPGNAWIVTEKQSRDTLAFLKNATLAELKDVFSAAASCPDDGAGKFILLHAVKDGDKVQNTNSKLPSLHIHVFAGPFAPEFNHISDPNVKSYAVQPNPHLGDTIKDALDASKTGDFQTITLDKDHGGEAQSHSILAHQGFSGFDNFTRSATDGQWNGLKDHLAKLIEPWVQEGAGGARVIIDDRYTNTGCLTVQILAGENLDRSGQNKQRYFEKPSPAL